MNIEELKRLAEAHRLADVPPVVVLELIQQRDELLAALKLMLSGGTGCLSAARSAIAKVEKQA